MSETQSLALLFVAIPFLVAPVPALFLAKRGSNFFERYVGNALRYSMLSAPAAGVFWVLPLLDTFAIPDLARLITCFGIWIGGVYAFATALTALKRLQFINRVLSASDGATSERSA